MRELLFTEDAQGEPGLSPCFERFCPGPFAVDNGGLPGGSVLDFLEGSDLNIIFLSGLQFFDRAFDSFVIFDFKSFGFALEVFLGAVTDLIAVHVLDLLPFQDCFFALLCFGGNDLDFEFPGCFDVLLVLGLVFEDFFFILVGFHPDAVAAVAHSAGDLFYGIA